MHFHPLARCRTKKHFSKLFFSCCPKSSQPRWFAASPLATGSNVRLSTCRPTGTHDPSIPEIFKAPQPMSMCYILISGSPKCPAASLLPKHGFPANAVAPGSKTSASKLDRCCNRAAHAVRRTYLIQFTSTETSKHETSCVVKLSWGKHAVQLYKSTDCQTPVGAKYAAGYLAFAPYGALSNLRLPAPHALRTNCGSTCCW